MATALGLRAGQARSYPKRPPARHKQVHLHLLVSQKYLVLCGLFALDLLHCLDSVLW